MTSFEIQKTRVRAGETKEIIIYRCSHSKAIAVILLAVRTTKRRLFIVFAVHRPKDLTNIIIISN
jgi:hypothetical protein